MPGSLFDNDYKGQTENNIRYDKIPIRQRQQWMDGTPIESQSTFFFI